MPRKTKIGTEVVHVTHDADTISRSKGQRTTCRGGAYCGGLPHSLFRMQCAAAQSWRRWSSNGRSAVDESKSNRSCNHSLTGYNIDVTLHESVKTRQSQINSNRRIDVTLCTLL